MMTAVLKPSSPNRRSLPTRLVSNARGSNVALFPPPVKTRREQQQLARSRTAPLARSRPTPLSVVTPTVKTLPTSRSFPLWLQLLAIVQRSSSVITVVLVTVVLALYGRTVHSQQLWGREYRDLEALQRQERQLMAANEVLKHEMAQQAEDPVSGLVSPNRDHLVFLKPAAPRPIPAIAPQPIQAPPPSGPLGY